MEKKENKENKARIILIITLSLLVIALCGYILSGYIGYKKNINDKNKTVENSNDKEKDNTKEKESNDNPNKTTTNNETHDFDFNELSNTLHSSLEKENMQALVSTCEEKSVDENGIPNTEYKNNVVSKDTVDTIINKLKEAKTIDNNITFSWFGCPPKQIAYYISVNSNDQIQLHSQSKFSLYYANGEDILLVGYNSNGYAFHYNSKEEISNFIESLE